MASVTCRLTAADRDQLRNPTLVSNVGLPLGIFAGHFGANDAILWQMIQNLSVAKLCAVFSETPCKLVSGLLQIAENIKLQINRHQLDLVVGLELQIDMIQDFKMHNRN